MGLLRNGLFRALFAVPALALLCGLAPLWLAARELPLVEVQSVPWLTHHGRLLERYPAGQGFTCDAPGLRRIDVALVAIRRPARGGVTLRLREDHRAGDVVREVTLPPESLPGSGAVPESSGWARFDFEPVEDSAKRSYYFELLPAGDTKPGDHGVHVRFHGAVGHNGEWSDQRVEGPVVEGRLREAQPPGSDVKIDDPNRPDDVPHPWLRAVSFATLGVAPRLGEARLELWEEGAEDGPPLRVATLAPEDEVQTGHVFFAFDPIEASRWKRYRYRLTLPPHTVLIGDRWGPSMKTWHGLEGGDPRLQGATVGGEARHDRDLVFRAFARPDPGAALELAAERAGPRLRWGVGLWLGAALVLLALALHGRRKSAPAPFHLA